MGFPVTAAFAEFQIIRYLFPVNCFGNCRISCVTTPSCKSMYYQGCGRCMKHFASVVSRVCSAWHELVQSSQRLWFSHLILNSDESHYGSAASQLTRIETFMSGSQDCDFDVEWRYE